MLLQVSATQVAYDRETDRAAVLRSSGDGRQRTALAQFSFNFFSEEPRFSGLSAVHAMTMLSLRVRQTSAARQTDREKLLSRRPRERSKQSAKERTYTYLEDVRHVVGGVAVVVTVQPHPVLPQLLPDEPVVDEGRAPEVRQDQPRRQQQLRLVPQRYPAKKQ